MFKNIFWNTYVCTCIYILMNASARSVFLPFFYTPYWIDATCAYTKINGIKTPCVSVFVVQYGCQHSKGHGISTEKCTIIFFYCDTKIYAYVMCNKWSIVGKKDANLY